MRAKATCPHSAFSNSQRACLHPQHHFTRKPLLCHPRRTNVIPVRCHNGLPPIMVNSCTGRMGHATAEAIVRAGLQLVPYTLSGYSAAVAVSNIAVAGIPVEIVGQEKRQERMEQVKAKYPDLIVVDFTTPYCVNDNGSFYVSNRLPFIMGTTGGDREALKREAEDAGVYAIISPQMGKQVVAFQAMMDMMGSCFPGSFTGYSLEVWESHQRQKADVSGTAKEVVKSLNKLGVNFDESQIRKIRTPSQQTDLMKVPESALDGHAFHTYKLTSADGNVSFEFKHNVVGRSIYAEGTVDALLFLAKQVKEKAPKFVYSMGDVLEAGALR